MVWPSGANRAEATCPPRKVRRVNTGFEAGTVARPAQNAAAAANSRTGIAATNEARHRPILANRDAGTAFAELLSEDKLSKSKARSRADWKRKLGSFSRQWRTIRSRPGETCRPVSVSSGGSSLRMAFMVSTLESPLNARLREI